MANKPKVILLSPPGNLAVRKETAELVGNAGEIEDLPFVVSDAGSYSSDLLARIESYLDSIQVLLESEITEPVQVVALGHTGCSYVAALRRPGWFDEVLSSTPAEHVVTAAGALEDYLRHEGITRFELISPYPLPVHNLAVQYWTGRGYDVALNASMAGYNGAKSIYEITEADVAAFIAARTERSELAEPLQAIVVSGTGAPSLGVLEALESELGIRVISVNFAFGRAIATALGTASPA